MPVNAGDTVHVTFEGLCFAQQIIYDFSYVVTVGNSTASTTAVLNELLSEMVQGGANDCLINYLSALPASYSLTAVRAQVIKPTRSAYVPQTFIGKFGTNANPASVACDSMAITCRTPLAGRKQVSTVKIGPLPDALSAAGVITGPGLAIAALIGADRMKTLILPVSTCQFKPCILDKNGNYDGRDLATFLVARTSRVMTRRVVGRGK